MLTVVSEQISIILHAKYIIDLVFTALNFLFCSTFKKPLKLIKIEQKRHLYCQVNDYAT